MRFIGGRTVCLAVWLVGLSGTGMAMEHYVAPTGSSDSNNGSIGSPFATFGKAIGLANAGDTIFARGGTYNLNSTLSISKGGVSGNPINLWAYPGETPILDFSAQADDGNNRGVQLSSSADWWHMKGLTIQHAGDNGFNTSGDHGVFEQLVTRYNRDSGFQYGGSASYNLSLNCDSYGNYDPPKRGEDADGFAVKSASIGPGNILMGNRSWDNSDDGYDFFGSRANGVLMIDCWAFDNGFDPGGSGPFTGDGNGFKLGHDSGSHILANVLAISNPEHGIDVNGNGYIYVNNVPTQPNGSLVQVYNSTSFDNGGSNFYFDENLPHTLQNNISFSGNDSDNFAAQLVNDHNTWNGAAFAVSAADFESIDLGDGGAQQIAEVLRGPRQADGSLPDLGSFLQLVAGSNLVDAGVPVSFTFGGVTYNLPYNGLAPDLGAFEFVPAGPALPGDYNGDNIVDASDYTVWRNNLNTDALLPNDETPGFVDEEDYGVWKSHFGQSLPGGGSLAQSPVPEPGTAAAAILAAALLLGICRQASSIGRVSVHGRR
jgi:Pel9A-like, right handed beta helix region